jgi:hypothetical protein
MSDQVVEVRRVGGIPLKFLALYGVATLGTALLLYPIYEKIGNDQMAFLATPNGKMLKTLLVALFITWVVGLILPEFAPFDETEKQLTKFLKSKGVVGAPSFRSV